MLDLSFSFVGNVVTGGRQGVFGNSTLPRFHVRAPYWDGQHWFMVRNNYVNTNGVPVSPVFVGQQGSVLTNLPVQYQP